MGPPTTRGRPHRHAAGFTLVEVLVVVLITGIVIATAAVNLFPSELQLARRETGEVALAIERARDAAWFGGRPTSITFTEGRLREWRYGSSGWREAAQRDQALPPELRITAIHVDGQALPAGERLVFMPDGLGIPFRVALEVRGVPLAVEGDAVGAVTMVEP